MLLTLYLMLALGFSYYVYEKLQNSGLSGDQLISMLPDNKTRMYLYNNPNTYRFLLITGIILLGLFWPITLIYVISHLDDIDKFGKL